MFKYRLRMTFYALLGITCVLYAFQQKHHLYFYVLGFLFLLLGYHDIDK